MKGLRKYLKVHGYHFTEELAYNATDCKWNADLIKNISQKEVYYNITSSSLGDIVYFTNMLHNYYGDTKYRCLKGTLYLVGDYYAGEGFAFRYFIDMLKKEKKDFDFTPYV